jgi:hypothetical protein
MEYIGCGQLRTSESCTGEHEKDGRLHCAFHQLCALCRNSAMALLGVANDLAWLCGQGDDISGLLEVPSPWELSQDFSFSACGYENPSTFRSAPQGWSPGIGGAVCSSRHLPKDPPSLRHQQSSRGCPKTLHSNDSPVAATTSAHSLSTVYHNRPE